MKSILIQSIITISLFFCLIPVTYACNSLVIEIRNGEGESLDYMYLKTEVRDYITVQVTSTENVVKDDGDGWHWNEPEGLDITFYSKTSTQLILGVESDSINSYNLTITAEPEMGGDNATDSCTIRAADISLNCPDLISYAEGMNINCKLNPPISIPIGIIRIMNSSGNRLFMGGFYQYGPYPIDKDYPWDGKGDTSPYNGLYLPGGDYKVIYSALGFEIEKEFRIVEVDSLSDVDYYTGRQYIPVSNEDFDVYENTEYGFYYADTTLELWADSDPHDIYGGTCFPSGSPLWSCTMTPTDPPISSRNGYSSILVNNFLGNQTGNFTITAKASINDPVGASIDLTSFTATVEPDNEYIGYEMGTDITYNISPGTGWSYYSAEICIINESCDYVYKCEVPGFTGELGWDGMGNWDYEQGQYTEPFYLPPGTYWIGIEIIPFYGSDKYLYYTSYYSPNLTVCIQKITLGSSASFTQKIFGEIYIPTKWGGKLTVTTTSGTISDLKYPDGSAYTNGTEIGTGKQGWYTFKIADSTSFTVSNTFIQTRSLPDEPWCTYWWASDQQHTGPHQWEDPATYTPNESGVLKKYDASGTATTAWNVENSSYKCNHGSSCSAGHCDAAALAGLSMATKPSGDKTVGGIIFREKDRLGIAVQRYWVAPGPDCDEPGDDQSLFRKTGTNLTNHAEWFHRKLLRRIAGVDGSSSQGGVLVRANNWNMGVYKYEASFVAYGTSDSGATDKSCVNISNTLTWKSWSWTYPTSTHNTSYAISYDVNGEVSSHLSWTTGVPDLVCFKKASGTLCNSQVNESKTKAESIISP